ncbi:MAG TPA: HAD family phosphatase [Solirubrobacteraceae bacterium]|jgi:HAD superfamily hydrolase (TIGR01509 family)|nr:HAD family phosphatase [Solirubrobacteraceae bacterium]
MDREPRDHLDAVCFDLDGVLIDSEHAWDAARRAVVGESGGLWRPEATRAMMGMSAAEWSQYLHDELGVPLSPPEINERVVERLLAGYRRELPLLPGAVAAVKRLAARWPLGLASSSNRPVIDYILEASGLAGSFAVTVSADEVARGKPAPDVYLAAAAKLSVAPTRAAAVEDSSNGLRSAAGAGMLVVAIPNREFPPEADALALADVILESLAELVPEALDARAAARPELRWPLSAPLPVPGPTKTT